MLPWIRAREYPSNPDEAFVMSGNMVFDLDTLRLLENDVRLPNWVALDEDYECVSQPPRRERERLAARW